MFSRLRRVLALRGTDSDENEAESSNGKEKAEATVKEIRIDGQDYIYSVVFTTDGKYLLAGGEEGKIRCWETDDGKEITRRKSMDAGDWALNVAVSQDGKWIVSGAMRGYARVFDAESGEIATELNGHASTVSAVDVSLDGTRIATGSTDGTARVWALSNGDELLKLGLGYGEPVKAVKFSPSGLLLATVTSARGWDGPVRLYECNSGRLLVTGNFHIRVNSELYSSQSIIAWHHDSKHLFVASNDGHIYRLDVPIGNIVSKWRIRSDYIPRCIALASDSAYIAASAGPWVSFWDTVTHQEIGSPIEYTAHVFSMAISTNHDIVTGGSNTITVRNLRDIIPSHYCDNTTRNLHTDLMDLRRRYRAQSRKLLQIAALKAELAHSIALKTEELAAIRRELDQFPDVSRELAFTRNELRWSETRMNEIHQQYRYQLRDISSNVANHKPDCSIIHQCITDSVTSVEKSIMRTLQELNVFVQRTSMSISTYFMPHIKSTNAEARLSAARSVFDTLPQSLVHHLLAMPSHTLPWYLPVALRAYLTSYLYTIISSWTSDNKVDKLIGHMYERVCKSEPQTFPASWRSQTSSNIPASEENSNIFVSRAMRGLSDVIVAAGCATSVPDTQSKLSTKFWHDISPIILAAGTLRDLIRGALPADFKVVLVHPTQTFDRTTMVVDQQTGLGTAARGRVLCTTRLGLVKEVVGGQDNTLTITTVVKAAVVLQENR